MRLSPFDRRWAYVGIVRVLFPPGPSPHAMLLKMLQCRPEASGGSAAWPEPSIPKRKRMAGAACSNEAMLGGKIAQRRHRT
jgi:hypothetical protein